MTQRQDPGVWPSPAFCSSAVFLPWHPAQLLSRGCSPVKQQPQQGLFMLRGSRKYLLVGLSRLAYPDL